MPLLPVQVRAGPLMAALSAVARERSSRPAGADPLRCALQQVRGFAPDAPHRGFPAFRDGRRGLRADVLLRARAVCGGGPRGVGRGGYGTCLPGTLPKLASWVAQRHALPAAVAPAAEGLGTHAARLYVLLPQAAPDVVKDETGVVVARKLHCYVVFADHLGACLAKRSLTPKGADAAGAKDQALRVRFAKPQSVVPACTAPFKAFVASQWATVCAAAKASPELKRPSCKINALFISKLHQHITSGRLCALFGKFGKMIACEVCNSRSSWGAGGGRDWCPGLLRLQVPRSKHVGHAVQQLQCTGVGM